MQQLIFVAYFIILSLSHRHHSAKYEQDQRKKPVMIDETVIVNVCVQGLTGSTQLAAHISDKGQSAFGLDRRFRVI